MRLPISAFNIRHQSAPLCVHRTLKHFMVAMERRINDVYIHMYIYIQKAEILLAYTFELFEIFPTDWFLHWYDVHHEHSYICIWFNTGWCMCVCVNKCRSSSGSIIVFIISEINITGILVIFFIPGTVGSLFALKPCCNS